MWSFSESGGEGLSAMVARRAILMSTPAEGLVLDPFARGFAVAQAAQVLSRRFIGMELNEVRCRRARSRFCVGAPKSNAAMTLRR